MNLVDEKNFQFKTTPSKNSSAVVVNHINSANTSKLHVLWVASNNSSYISILLHLHLSHSSHYFFRLNIFPFHS